MAAFWQDAVYVLSADSVEKLDVAAESIPHQGWFFKTLPISRFVTGSKCPVFR